MVDLVEDNLVVAEVLSVLEHRVKVLMEEQVLLRLMLLEVVAVVQVKLEKMLQVINNKVVMVVME
jgi:hypothetical protein